MTEKITDKYLVEKWGDAPVEAVTLLKKADPVDGTCWIRGSLMTKSFEEVGAGGDVEIDGIFMKAFYEANKALVDYFYDKTIKELAIENGTMDDVGETWGKRATDAPIKEKFTKKEFKELEDINHHTEAAVKLVEKFGTLNEYADVCGIKRRHDKKGRIGLVDLKDRDALITKYYPKLKEERA